MKFWKISYYYINDFCFLQLQSKMALFADDTTIYFSSNSITFAVSILTDDLNKILVRSWPITKTKIITLYVSLSYLFFFLSFCKTEFQRLTLYFQSLFCKLNYFVITDWIPKWWDGFKSSLAYFYFFSKLIIS